MNSAPDLIPNVIVAAVILAKIAVTLYVIRKERDEWLVASLLPLLFFLWYFLALIFDWYWNFHNGMRVALVVLLVFNGLHLLRPEIAALIRAWRNGADSIDEY